MQVRLLSVICCLSFETNKTVGWQHYTIASLVSSQRGTSFPLFKNQNWKKILKNDVLRKTDLISLTSLLFSRENV